MFEGRVAALGTKHEKESIIAPRLRDALGLTVVVPAGFDSDQFGTFTGSVKRRGNQLEAARAKAAAAMDLLQCDIGIGSEGSFGPDPDFYFAHTNLELIVMIDRKNGLEIRGHSRTGKTNADGKAVSTAEQAVLFARSVGFPEHGVILRASKHLPLFIEKHLYTEDDIKRSFERLQRLPIPGPLYIETDMRAHRNPTRMQNIMAATEDLIANCRSLCTACHTPGFVPVEPAYGAICRLCEWPTDRPRGYRFECAKCHFKEERMLGDGLVEPFECQHCNP